MLLSSLAESVLRSWNIPTRTPVTSSVTAGSTDNPPQAVTDIEPARSDQGQSKLLSLPPELLDRIFAYLAHDSRHFETFCTLRTVCSLLDDICGARVVRHLTLRSPKKSSGPPSWEALTYERNAFSTGAHTLFIEDLVNDERSPASSYGGSYFSRERHEAQTKNLCASLRNLKAVRTVNWRMSTCLKLNHDILGVISQMPRVENLHFEIDRLALDGEPYTWNLQLAPLARLRTLRSISLDVYPKYQRDRFRSLSQSIHHLLAGCHALESVSLAGPDDASVDFALDVLLDLDPNGRGPTSFIRSLTLHKMDITPTPTFLNYVSHLTSLSIFNDRRRDGAVWEALQSSSIHLQVVKVAQVTNQLLDYLRSYRGLEEFHGIIRHNDMEFHGWSRPSPVDEGPKDRLLESVLPLHRHSLKAFVCAARICLNERQDAARWALCEKQVAALRTFEALETIEVSLVHDANWNGLPPFVSLTGALTLLLDLPGPITGLHIHLFGRQTMLSGFCDAIQSNLKEFSRFELPSTWNSTLLRSVVVYGRECPVYYDAESKVHRFDIGEEWERDPAGAAVRILPRTFKQDR